MSDEWLIYGANGFSADLIIREALDRGHYPVIAGRNPEKISAIADKYKLPFRIFNLDSDLEIEKNLSDMKLVLNCAGPFIFTADQLVRACLKTKTHYLDITGEVPVFEKLFSLDDAARENKILVIPGVGFDVVPTDCMAKFITDEFPGAENLEIAFSGISSPTSGTMNSMLEMLPEGGLIRKNGVLEKFPLGAGAKDIPFQGLGLTKTIPIPWGDISTASRTTGIPNILIYSGYPEILILLLPFLEPPLRILLSSSILRKSAQRLVNWMITGPDSNLLEKGKMHVYVKAIRKDGTFREAWLNTLEAYSFTAKSSVLCVEKALKSYLRGTLTPSQAFGKDLVMEISGSERFVNI